MFVFKVSIQSEFTPTKGFTLTGTCSVEQLLDPPLTNRKRRSSLLKLTQVH